MNKLSKCSMDRTRNTERRQLVFLTSSRRDKSFLWFQDVKPISPIILHATKKSPKDFGVCFIWPFPNFRFNMWNTFQSFSTIFTSIDFWNSRFCNFRRQLTYWAIYSNFNQSIHLVATADTGNRFCKVKRNIFSNVMIYTYLTKLYIIVT